MRVCKICRKDTKATNDHDRVFLELVKCLYLFFVNHWRRLTSFSTSSGLWEQLGQAHNSDHVLREIRISPCGFKEYGNVI